jgi:t-SNARE complex subunit (syntaxin)
MIQVSIDTLKQMKGDTDQLKTNNNTKNTSDTKKQGKESKRKKTNEEQQQEQLSFSSDVVAVRENIVVGYSKQLQQEGVLYRQAQENYKIAMKDKMKRQLHFINPQINDTTIDENHRGE